LKVCDEQEDVGTRVGMHRAPSRRLSAGMGAERAAMAARGGTVVLRVDSTSGARELGARPGRRPPFGVLVSTRTLLANSVHIGSTGMT
jgi:hypothetical protein